MDTEKMPRWYFEKEDLKYTPSVQDGIDYKTECRYRKEGAKFIINTGFNMNLRYNTVATGVVYFHRFYMFHSFKQFPRYVTACCCLFLAGKVEETPKKCRDIIDTAKSLLPVQKFMTFGEDPKKEIMTLEKILLQTIKFDLQVEHPYSYLLKYAKCLKGDQRKLQEMVQMAWTFVNDSLCTTLSLQWEQEIIAIALIYLASKLTKFEIIDWEGRQPEHLRWWDMFVEDLSMDQLEDICHQVLDSYISNNERSTNLSPPASVNSPNQTNVSPTTTTEEELIPVNSVCDVTPAKIPEIGISLLNCCPQLQNINPAEISLSFPPPPLSHYSSYSVSCPPVIPYSPIFPLTDLSVPPPPINTNNHTITSKGHGSNLPPIRPILPYSSSSPASSRSYYFLPSQ